MRKRWGEMNRAERTGYRVRMLAGHLAEATKLAHTTGRQLECWPDTNQWGVDRHSGRPNGCPDDGSGCICPCHDPKE